MLETTFIDLTGLSYYPCVLRHNPVVSCYKLWFRTLAESALMFKNCSHTRDSTRSSAALSGVTGKPAISPSRCPVWVMNFSTEGWRGVLDQSI